MNNLSHCNIMHCIVSSPLYHDAYHIARFLPINSVEYNNSHVLAEDGKQQVPGVKGQIWWLHISFRLEALRLAAG